MLRLSIALSISIALLNIAKADVYRSSCSCLVGGVTGTYDVIIDDKNRIAFFIQHDVRPNVPSAVSNSRVQPLVVEGARSAWPLRLFTLRLPSTNTSYVVSLVDHDFDVARNGNRPQETNSSRLATDSCG